MAELFDPFDEWRKKFNAENDAGVFVHFNLKEKTTHVEGLNLNIEFIIPALEQALKRLKQSAAPPVRKFFVNPYTFSNN